MIDNRFSNTVDGADRLLRQEIDLGAVSAAMEYDYTLAGLPTNAVCSVGGFSIATERDFDPAGRLEVLSSDAGDFELGYDPQSGLPASISNSVSGVNAVYQYNSLGQVSNIVWRKSDGTVLQSHALSYDNADMVAEIKCEDGSSRQFGYDGLNRLVSEQSDGSTVQYDYDRSGNRTNQTVNGVDTAYALGSGNRLLSFGASGSVSHDAAGNVTNIVYNDGRELDIEWNGQYQITTVSTNGVLAEGYGYDAAGRRAWIASGGTTNYMVYDGPHCVAEVDSSGNPLKSYTWGPGIDNLLSMTVYGASETNTYYALTDHLGTVTALADDTGAIVESYEYDAWGNITVYDENDAVIPQSQYGNRFTFQGREYSWSTGLYNFRARWYDPVTGRWLSKDPIGISGGLNQYVFCGNNPVMFVDPWGLCEESFKKDARKAYWSGFIRGFGSGALRGAKRVFNYPDKNADPLLYLTAQGGPFYLGNIIPTVAVTASIPAAVVGDTIMEGMLLPARLVSEDIPYPTPIIYEGYKDVYKTIWLGPDHENQ